MSPKLVRLFASAALCAAWALLALPGGTAAQGKGPKKVPKLLAATSLGAPKESDDLRQLVRARYQAALDEARVRYRQFQDGGGNLAPLLDAYRRLLAAGVAVADTGKNRLVFLEEYVDLARDAERITAAGVKSGQMTSAEAAQARYLRLDAEIQLLRTRRILTGPKPAPVP